MKEIETGEREANFKQKLIKRDDFPGTERECVREKRTEREKGTESET